MRAGRAGRRGAARRPAVTRDGMHRLHLNVAFLIDLVALETTNTDGVGLYRTEFAFMVRDRFRRRDAGELMPRCASWQRQAGGVPPLDVSSDGSCHAGLSRTGRPWAGARCA
jgi:phosphotransferase system enzyme I (PtsP)